MSFAGDMAGVGHRNIMFDSAAVCSWNQAIPNSERHFVVSAAVNKRR